ncbi:MAG TPA: hypothetical protein VIS51_05190 [Solirubrobacterales bacterium]
MKRIRNRLTYANVMSTLAVVLVIGGATAIAAKVPRHSVGPRQLKANAVTTLKIKANAVTNRKIKKNAVTTVKIKDGSVDGAKIADGAVGFGKIATGTNVIATASGGPVAADSATAATIPLTGTTSFTPRAGVVDFLSVEVRGNDLAATGAEPCAPEVRPYVNESAFEMAESFLAVSAGEPTPEDPSGLRPVTGATAPLGMTSPGVTQDVAVKLIGDPDCAEGSTVSVAIAITRAK